MYRVGGLGLIGGPTRVAHPQPALPRRTEGSVSVGHRRRRCVPALPARAPTARGGVARDAAPLAERVIRQRCPESDCMGMRADGGAMPPLASRTQGAVVASPSTERRARIACMRACGCVPALRATVTFDDRWRGSSWWPSTAAEGCAACSERGKQERGAVRCVDRGLGLLPA